MDWDSIHFLMVLFFLGAIAYLSYELENPWSKFLIGVTVFFSVVAITGIYRSPTIKAVVIDAETRQPIISAAVTVSWHKIYGGPGGTSGGKTVKEMKINVGSDGSFKIPAQYLINCVPFPLGQWGEFGAVVYAHGYEMTHINKGHMPESGYVLLKRINDPARFGWKIMGLRAIAGEQYLKDEMRNYLERFGNKRWGREVQEELAYEYLQIEDYASALRKFEELAADYPENQKWYVEKIRECRSRIQTVDKPTLQDDYQVFLDQLNSVDVRVRRGGANALIERPHRSNIYALTRALQDEDVEVRMNAVAALGNIGEKQAFDALLLSLKDSNPLIRELSARYIGLSRDFLFVPALKAAMDDKETNVQEAITRSLRKIADTSNR